MTRATEYSRRSWQFTDLLQELLRVPSTYTELLGSLEVVLVVGDDRAALGGHLSPSKPLQHQDKPRPRPEYRLVGHAAAGEALRERASCTSSHSRFGLSGISQISSPSTPRASSTAWAKSGATGMAPASPAPLMPSGLSGEGVSTWPTSIGGTSSEVGSKKSISEPLSSCPFSSQTSCS